LKDQPPPRETKSIKTSKTSAEKPDPAAPIQKAVIDSLLLPIRGIEGGEMSGFPAYFVNKRMFACLNGNGVGIRLPATTAANLQFSRNDVSAFQPNGKPSTREWVQLDHADPADFLKDEALFLASIEFVKNDRK
jgi:hypothetical protein